MASGWFNSSPVPDQGADSGLALLIHLAHLTLAEEHVALLGTPDGFYRLLRKDDLLDDGVAVVFRWAGAEAELLGFCFHAGKFTAIAAMTWLAEWGFRPLLFVPNSGGNCCR